MRTRYSHRIGARCATTLVALLVVAAFTPAANGATFWVTTTADVGPGSFREQIMAANTAAGPDTIGFAIAGAGPHAIALTGALPSIWDTLCIDGYTQPGASPATAGTPATLMIELDAQGITSPQRCLGVTPLGHGSLIRGLAVSNCGFGDSGIGILLGDVYGCIVEGNHIGTGVSGTVQKGNGWGVGILWGGNHTIGGTTAAARNVISGNSYSGVEAQITSGNVLAGNYIGTTATGGSGLGNGLEGVDLYDASDNTIGGTDPGAANLIAYVTGPGVRVRSGTGNAILRNSIHSNGGLGINLGEDGTTPNDPGDPDTGPNEHQNFPTLTLVDSYGGTTMVQGVLSSTPNTTFRLEFFHNTVADPSGYGEGEFFLGSAMVTTDATGDVVFSETFPVSIPVGSYVSSTATDPDGNTSEFGPCETVVAVELASFAAVCELGVVRLRWSTLSERDNYGFHVYRSDGGASEYRRITDGLIPGAGTSSEPHYYSYSDRSVRAGNTYWYRLSDVDLWGRETFHGPVNVLVTPVEFAFGASSPNPFNSSATTKLSLAVGGHASVKVYNVSGELVRTLHNGPMEAGIHRIVWDGRDDRGRRLAPGTYTVTAVTQGVEQSRRVVLAR